MHKRHHQPEISLRSPRTSQVSGVHQPSYPQVRDIVKTNLLEETSIYYPHSLEPRRYQQSEP